MLILNNIGELATFDPDKEKVVYYHNCRLELNGNKIIQINDATPLERDHIDCQGKLVTPGFVDSHTHPVFLNGREEEFKMRAAGKSYKDIALAGGGINSSIKGVREAGKDTLIGLVTKRLDRFLKLGTTTIEAKSGYGLTTDSELKSLEVLKSVNDSHPISIHPTFMGAHAFPPEYSNDQSAYIDLLCNEMIPAVAEQGIAEFCDVFCENGYFTVEDSRRILKTAEKYGMKIRMHADEFEDSGAAALAGEMKALSADHLMAVSDKGISALAENNVIATLLPGTTFFLGLDKWAPAKKIKDAGVDIALATDFNPGSCMIQSMPLIISMACIHLGMNVEDALAGSTYFGAKSLGLNDRVGAIKNGYQADILVWDLNKWEEVPYLVSDLPLKRVYKDGKLIS